MCLEDTKSITGHPAGSESQLKVSEKKKPQVKAMKKHPAENKNGLDSDSGVSITDGNTNPSIACNRKKKFSKTAKLLSQVEQTVEEFDDSNPAEEIETKRQEKRVTIEEVAAKMKQNLQREKLVNQVKRDSQEKPVKRVHDCEDKEEGRGIMRRSAVNDNGEKRNDAKNVRIASDEGRSEDDDADVEEETCTEEDVQRSQEENEPRAERKQRTKLVKKARVRPS